MVDTEQAAKITDPLKTKFTSQSLLSPDEIFWVSCYNYLFQKGYKLRPRYHPDWIPSWGLDGSKDSKFKSEDARMIQFGRVIDATRLKDKKQVVIKRASLQEASIVMHMTAQLEEPGNDNNRTVPIWDSFPIPMSDGEVFIVMPKLYIFDRLPFRRFGEFVEAMHQFLKGLSFMHGLNIAHRDACKLNMCLDPTRVIPKGFHFVVSHSYNGIYLSKFSWRDRWSVKPVQYYFIDFGLSTRYPPGETNIKDIGIVGQDKTVPERSLEVPYDPFKMDVYQLGNTLKNVITEYEGLERFEPLLDSMVMTDPNLRPTASAALEIFEQSIKDLKKPDLKRRIWLKKSLPQWRFKIKWWGWNPAYA